MFERGADGVSEPLNRIADSNEQQQWSPEARSKRRTRPVLLNDIRERAYQKWQAAGSPPGNSLRFWLEAERELLQASEETGEDSVCYVRVAQ